MKKSQLVLGALIIVTSFIVIGTVVLVRARPANRKGVTAIIEKAALSERVSVQSSGRGNPDINLSDGHELITPYQGPDELVNALESNEARGLSLASADFDEDGVPDLISGYAGPHGGIITLVRGNVDSIYPNTTEAKQRKAQGTFTDAPFLSPAFVLATPEVPNFIGTGDFDADGHFDIVTAARGSSTLYLMSGDGKGRFSLSTPIVVQDFLYRS